MDILGQYKRENPGSSLPSASGDVPGFPQREGFLVRLVMRFSGGRIRNVFQATGVLIAIAILVIILSALFIFRGNNSGRISEEDLRKLMREAPPPSVVEPRLVR